MRKIIFTALMLFMLIALTACNGNDDTSEVSPTQNENAHVDVSGDQPSQHTLEELGATIEAAGEFWNKWWASHHTFEWEHIDDSRRNWQPWDEAITPAHHPLSRGFAVVLPSSGFASLDDVGAHLSQFFTQGWVNAWTDRRQFAEPYVTMRLSAGEYPFIFGFYGFEEYDDELFLFIQTEWSARPNWLTATHTLIEQDENRAVIETVVSTYIPGQTPQEVPPHQEEIPTIRYRFTLIDGKIDSGSGQMTMFVAP